MRRKMRLYISVFFLMMSGCDGEKGDASWASSVDRIEFFYRDIDALAPIHYTELDLVRRASVKIKIPRSDPEWDELINIASTCEEDGELMLDDVDAYVVVHFYGQDVLVRSLVASPFNYYVSPSEQKVCHLRRARLEQIVAIAAKGEAQRGQ